MASGELDLERLGELQALLDRDVEDIVATLLQELTRAFAELDAAVAAEDLPAASGAAHSARNSALMIDARPMLADLGALERSARADDGSGVRSAHAELRERWPRLRRELEAIASPEPRDPAPNDDPSA